MILTVMASAGTAQILALIAAVLFLASAVTFGVRPALSSPAFILLSFGFVALAIAFIYSVGP